MIIKALSLKPLYAPDGDGDEPGVLPVPVATEPPEEEDDLLNLDEGDKNEGDEGLEADAGDDEGVEQPQLRQAARPKESASDRIRRLNDDRKREAERAAALEAELREYRAERERERAAREAQSEEDRLALMTTEERIDFKLRKAQEENQRLMAQQQFASADQLDKLEFRQKLPRQYSKYADEVETLLQSIRTKNKINVPRETALKLLLGEKLLEQTARKESAPKRPDTSRRQPPPAQSRGDLNGDRRTRQSLEKRLENVAL